MTSTPLRLLCMGVLLALLAEVARGCPVPLYRLLMMAIIGGASFMAYCYGWRDALRDQREETQDHPCT